MNVKIDPARLYSSKNGISDLAVAVDVDISDSGRLSRRKGFTQKASGSFHSLFCDGGQCLCVSGTDLCVLNEDYTVTTIGTVTEGARLSACQTPLGIYFCNGHENGVVQNSAVSDWVSGTYVGPETKRTFVSPPMGTIVEYYRTRMYVVQHNTLWFSEPSNYGSFDLARNFFQYPTEIRMVKAVKEGLFVSTEQDTYFLAGKTPFEMEQVKVAGYPAVKYSVSKCKGVFVLGPEGLSFIESGEESILWMTEQGICSGGPDGSFYNLTEDKVTGIPKGTTGAGLVANNRYIGLINP